MKRRYDTEDERLRDEMAQARDEARRERDNARAEVSRREREHGALVETAQKALACVAAERDEARRERDEARARVAAEAGKDLAAWAADLDAAEAAHARVVAERDEARAEVERLRDERRQLRARLVECRPWVGVVPYPNTPAFSEMLAIRDLADDTLEEVQP